MPRTIAFSFAAALVAVPARGEDRTPPAKQPSLTERVNGAIDRGVEWLRRRQPADGSYGDMHDAGARSYGGGTDVYEFPAGPTAFALYTLLKCETSPADPGVQRGFDALRKLTSADSSSYEIAATVLAIEAKYDQVKREQKREAASGLKAEPGRRPDLKVKPSKEDALWMGKLVAALGDRFSGDGWRYFRPSGDKAMGARQDTSSTAIAMLALLAAHRCGIDVPRKTVVSAMQWALAQQDAAPKDAGPEVRARGWAYVRRSPIPAEQTKPSGNMTTAGLITLLAGSHILEDTSPDTMKSMQTAVDRSVADGIAWLGANWRIDDNPCDAQHYHYMFLYGLERVGDLRRVALIAGHDWYTEGATLLVLGQRDDGSWLKTDTHPPYDVVNTCFALLFLDRASLAVTTPK